MPKKKAENKEVKNVIEPDQDTVVNEEAEKVTEVEEENKTVEEPEVKQDTENQPQVKNDQVELMQQFGDTLVVRAKEGLSKGQLELLGQLLKAEGQRTGYKMVLMPYSVDSVELK